MDLFHGNVIFSMNDGRGWFWTFIVLQLVRCTHSVWMVHSMMNMSSPFLFGSLLEVDGNVSWRDGRGPGLDRARSTGVMAVAM